MLHIDIKFLNNEYGDESVAINTTVKPYLRYFKLLTFAIF